MATKLNCYLNFDGQCAEAMRFYEQTFEGSKLEGMMKWSEMPDGGPDAKAAGDRIMHASLDLGDGRVLMASDNPPSHPYQRMQGVTLSLGYPSVEAAQKIFDTLAAGGQVVMPMQKTFWSAGFGMLTDRFGTPWMVNVDHG